MSTRMSAALAALVATVGVMTGCHGGYGSSNSGNGAGSDVANQTFTGEAAGPGTAQSGTVTLNFGSLPPGYSAGMPMGGTGMPMAGTGTIVVAGTLSLEGGQAVQLSGSYDPGSRVVSVQGSGYSLSGSITNGLADGTLSTPAGPGSFVAEKGSRAQIALFCGDYRDAQGGSIGPWLLSRAGTSVEGVFSDSTGGTRGTLRGSANAGPVTLNALDANGGMLGTATGSFSGNDASGTWTFGSSSGTWTVSAGNCP